jgi:predicted RNase H-like HicB family nuclease
MIFKIKIIKDKATGYLTGQLVGLPEVISEGKNLEELKINIIDALRLVLEVKSELKKAKPISKTSTLTKKKNDTVLYELSV